MVGGLIQIVRVNNLYEINSQAFNHFVYVQLTVAVSLEINARAGVDLHTCHSCPAVVHDNYRQVEILLNCVD